MLESIDLYGASGSQKEVLYGGEPSEISPRSMIDPSSRYLNKNVVFLFILVSFGYMLPWVAIGSLITYYTNEYGDSYFVILNVAFYAVGYPVSFTQRKLDLYCDTVMGSERTFKVRMGLCFVILLILLILLPTAGEIGTIILVALTGVFTWIAHGSASQLASMVKNNSNIFQQIGFALPGVFVLVMFFSLRIDGDSSIGDLFMFYGITLVFVFMGLLSWVYLGRSDLLMISLSLKDENVSSKVFRKMDEKRNPLTVQLSGATAPFYPHEESDQRKDVVAAAVYQEPALLNEALKAPEVRKKLWSNQAALFITIFCSILQGAFLTYVPSSKEGFSIALVLFYTRMFCDLLGRPLALLRKPKIFADINAILIWTIIRFVFMLVFFIYIAVPSNNSSSRNDWAVIFFQIFFSVSSGYFNSLTYEYAANQFSDELKRFQGAQILSVTFQQACFFAVVTATIILVIINTL